MVLTFVIAALVASAFLLCAAYAADRLVLPPSFLSPVVLTSGLFIIAYIWRPILYLLDPRRATVFPDYGTNFDPGLIAILMLASTLGIAAFIGGYAFGGGKRIAGAMPVLEWRNPWYVLVVLVVFGGIAALVMRRFLTGANFFQMMLVNFAVARQFFYQNIVGNGPIIYFVNNISTWLLVALVLFVATKGSSFRGRGLLVLLSVALFVFGALSYIVLLQRAPLITLILYPILVTHFYIRRIPVSIQLLFLGAMIAAVGVIGLFMLGRLASSSDGGAGELFLAMAWRMSGTFDQFEALYRAVLKTTTFRFGAPFLQDAVLTYMPRSLWPDKPELYGFVLLQNDLMPRLFQGAGLRATFPVGFMAESYMNFGWAGFVIGPFIYGVMVRVLTECSLDAKSGYSLLWLQTLAANISIVRSLSSYFSLFVFPLAVILIFVRPVWRRRSAAQPGSPAARVPLPGAAQPAA